MKKVFLPMMTMKKKKVWLILQKKKDEMMLLMMKKVLQIHQTKFLKNKNNRKNKGDLSPCKGEGGKGGCRHQSRRHLL